MPKKTKKKDKWEKSRDAWLKVITHLEKLKKRSQNDPAVVDVINYLMGDVAPDEMEFCENKGKM